eukprot:gene17172-20423_t
MFGFGFGSAWDGDRVDRGTWAAKSAAAERREEEAKQLFNAFLIRCHSLTDFPVTEEVVPAKVHLTEASWKDFRKHVIANGCSCKRRQADRSEKEATGDKRQGKMYFIAITVPVHPARAVEVQAANKNKAAAAQAVRKEREAKAAEVKAEQEAERTAAMQTQYEAIVAQNKRQAEAGAGASASEGTTPISKRMREAGGEALRSAAPTVAGGGKGAAGAVDAVAMIQHVEAQYQEDLKRIEATIQAERRQLLGALEEKKQQQEAAAREERDRVKAVIFREQFGFYD